MDTSTAIDPTQKVAETDGRSPSAMMVSTFSDELAIHTAGRAKIFAVSTDYIGHLVSRTIWPAFPSGAEEPRC